MRRTIFLGNPNRATRHPSSLSSTIRMQLQSLLTLLQDRKSHYVLCIKPNESKKPGLFELPLVQHQIRYLSLMPLVNIWRMGYCHHLTHVNFFNRYKLLHNDTWPFYEQGNLIEGIATIIRGLPLPSAEFILGTSCVFMRSPRTVFELEEFRRNRLNHLMIIIQTRFRSFVKRKKFLQMKRSQIIIARTWRTWRVSAWSHSPHLWLVRYLCNLFSRHSTAPFSQKTFCMNLNLWLVEHVILFLLLLYELCLGLSFRCLYWAKTRLGIISSCKFTLLSLLFRFHRFSSNSNWMH